MTHQPETAADDPLLQPAVFAVSECRKRKIPARLQELQTANDGFHLQESTKENIINGCRFHLQKYRPGSKTVCPECGRKFCFTRYIDEAGEISFPNKVGICNHINSCGYHYTPKEYFPDNPAVKEKLNEQERNGGTSIGTRRWQSHSPNRNHKYPFSPLIGWNSPCAGTTSTPCSYTLPK